MNIEKITYDEDIYSELALKLLEDDISFIASRYYIHGYDKEDLEQELRLILWNKIKYFNHLQGTMLRTWACKVMKNRLRSLLRKEMSQKKGEGDDPGEIPDNYQDFYNQPCFLELEKKDKDKIIRKIKYWNKEREEKSLEPLRFEDLL